MHMKEPERGLILHLLAFADMPETSSAAAHLMNGAAETIERLTAERDAALREIAQIRSQAGDSIECQEAEQRGYARAAAENERLRAALEPFVWAAHGMYVSGHCGGDSPEDFPARWTVQITAGPHSLTPQVWTGKQILTVADFRRAAAALDQQLSVNSEEGK